MRPALSRIEMIDGLWVMTDGPPGNIDIPELIRRGYDAGPFPALQRPVSRYEERHKRIMEGSGLE
jgi:hypothetical protein